MQPLKTFSALREFYGWTQADIADKTGLTQAAISQFETGKRNPDLESFGRLVKYLKLNPLTLMQIFLPDLYCPKCPDYARKCPYCVSKLPSQSKSMGD